MNEILYAGKHQLTHSVSRHAHDTWELIYCTGGQGSLCFDSGLVLSYEEGEIVVIPPLLPHINVSETGFTNIHLNLANCTLNFTAPTVFRDDGNRSVGNAFSAAYYHFCGEPGRRSALLSAYGDLLVCYINAYQEEFVHSRAVDLIVASIIQNYSDCNYELDAYLRTLPFSYDYLRKLFKKELGVTPHKYLVDKRLQTAVGLLRSMNSSGSNITEISQLCGFREPLYFSRMFKKKYGVAPSYFLQANPSAPLLDAESTRFSPLEDE